MVYMHIIMNQIKHSVNLPERNVTRNNHRYLGISNTQLVVSAGFLSKKHLYLTQLCPELCLPRFHSFRYHNYQNSPWPNREADKILQNQS